MTDYLTYFQENYSLLIIFIQLFAYSITTMHIQLPESKIVRILIVDDDEDDYIIASNLIAQIISNYRFQADWCPGYADALQKICSGGYDIYFIDYHLGSRTGLDLITEALQNNCEEPMVLLTGVGNQEIDLLAAQAGAVDYLVKAEMTAEKLERCIRYAMARHVFIKALKANEQKYRAIFEKSKDGVFVANMRLHFLDINQTGTELFGYRREEVLQMDLGDVLVNKEDAIMIDQEISSHGMLLDREIAFISKTGAVLQTTVSLTREKDEKSNFYLQGIVHDISGLKKMEKSKLQTEKFKATERLLMMLAHELRNPLNNILLASDHLAGSGANGEQKNLLDIIARNGSRINKMVTELMDASRATEVIKQRITLQSLMDSSLSAAADRITLNRIELTKAYPDRDAFIMADPAKMQIAFVNLIINALEAVDKNRGVLSITVQEENKQWLVSIEDNGPGMSQDILNRIFEPYFTSKKNGMGLGLASVLSIIKSNDAFVEVESTLGKGTRFLIGFEKYENKMFSLNISDEKTILKKAE